MKKKSILVKIILALILIVILVTAGYLMCRAVLLLVGGIEMVGKNMEADPQFMQEAEVITRPEYLDEEEIQPQHKTLDDYVPQVETPVDKTAEDLIREAQSTDVPQS